MAGLVVIAVAACMLAGVIPNAVDNAWLWVLVAMGSVSAFLQSDG